jgi:hypothetical protein
MDEASMPETATIRRRGERIPGPGGTGTYGPTTITNTPCRVAPLGSSAQERVIADQLQDTALEVLVVPKDADVQGTDSAIEVTNGKRYDIRGTVPEATYSIHKKFVVKAI